MNRAPICGAAPLNRTLGRQIAGVPVETITAVDIALNEQASRNRATALAAIEKWRTPSGALLAPVLFALLMALLIAFMPVSRANPIPYLVSMLGFAIVWVAVIAVRGNRRLEAVVQLLIQDARIR